MQHTDEQFTALGNYQDIIDQHVPEIAAAIGVSADRLKGWMVGSGEPTREQAGKILEFLDNREKTLK
jgi:hypothetical protein